MMRQDSGFPTMSVFTFAHRAAALGYPGVSSLAQILPLCSECVIGLSSVDDELAHILSKWARRDDRIRLISLEIGDPPQGAEAVSWWKNAYDSTLTHCSKEWVLRLDLDEFFHENDFPAILSALYLASRRNLSVIRTGLLELSADWRFSVDPSPFDQQRIWRRGAAHTAGDGSQAFARKGGAFDLRRVKCWHADLFLPEKLRRRKTRVGHTVHFPDIPYVEKDYLFKHQSLMEQAPQVLSRRGWRLPTHLTWVGALEEYPRALRLRSRWLSGFTHPTAERFIRKLKRQPMLWERFPISDAVNDLA